MTTAPSPTPTTVNLDANDVFNHIKAFTVHEMAKAEDILHSAHTGCEDDVAKITAQGAHAVTRELFEILTSTIQKAAGGLFDFKSETNKLLENINKLDPYMMSRIQLYMGAQPGPVDSAVETEIVN